MVGTWLGPILGFLCTGRSSSDALEEIVKARLGLPADGDGGVARTGAVADATGCVAEYRKKLLLRGLRFLGFAVGWVLVNGPAVKANDRFLGCGVGCVAGGGGGCEGDDCVDGGG